MLDQSLLDGVPLHGQKARMDTLGENLKERDHVFDAFEVRGDVQPSAEALPSATCDVVFIEDRQIEALGDCLLYSILVSCRLHTDGRGIRLQGSIYRKCVRNWDRNSRSGRRVIRDEASYILSSFPGMRPTEVCMC